MSSVSQKPNLNFLAKALSRKWSLVLIGLIFTKSLLAQLNIHLNYEHPSTCHAVDGSISVEIIEGTAPYSFSWNNGATTASLNGLAAGTYITFITDGLGQTASDTVILVEPPSFEASLNILSSACTGQGGHASVNVIGGTAPYIFQWSNGSSGQENDHLNEGNHTITIADANYCVEVISFDIETYNSLQLSLDTEDIRCYGEVTGSILAQPSGGIEPYIFEWNNGGHTSQLSDLIAGTYTLTLTDANGCTIVESASINEPAPLNSSISEFDINCFGENDGMAFSLVGGGMPPYTFEWSTGQSSESIEGLSAGVYSLTITDANECSVVNFVSIESSNTLTIDIEKTDALCANSNDGAATATVSGGLPPYNYIWSNGMISAGISDLATGDYSLTVTDDTGCERSVEVNIAAPPALSIGFTTSDNICSSDDNGAISVTVEGGTPPYNYLWNNGETTSSITDLSSGTYTLTVSDDHDCIKTFTSTISHTPGLEIIPASENTSCFGLNDGEASIEILGGTAPFNIQWSNGESSTEIINLSPGNYSVTVTGSAGCSAQASIFVDKPPQLVAQVNFVNVSCFGANDGSASAQFSNGGMPPYSYAWSNGETTLSINDLNPGSYQLTLTDANDCVNTIPFSIAEPSELILMVTAIDASCAGGETGAAAVTSSGGNGLFTYEWDNGEIGQIANELSAGVHEVSVTDPFGCEAIGAVLIEELNSFTCIAEVLQPIMNGNDGVARAAGIGGQAPYSYLWSNGETGSTIMNLGEGIYTVTITDDLGCESICEVDFTFCAEVGDYVWLDINRNGLQETGEPPLENVQLILSRISGNNTQNIDTTFSDANGAYSFCTGPGLYRIICTAPNANLLFTEENVGNDDDIDNDIHSFGISSLFIIGLEAKNNIDVGLYNKCENVTSPGQISGNQYLCGPGLTPELLSNEEDPTGGNGNFEYQWMYSTVPGSFDLENWQAIPNSSEANYQPGPIYETTYFTRCVRRECCSIYLESNVITITVGEESIATILKPDLICEQENYLFSAGPAVTNANFFWDFGAEVIPQTATTSDVEVWFPSFGPYTISLSVTQNGCTSIAEELIFVTNSPTDCGNEIINNSEMRAQQNIGHSRTKNGGKQSDLLLIYPNPSNDNFVLEFFETFEQDVRMDIISSSGITLTTTVLPKDMKRKEVNFSDYSAGIYFIRLAFGKKDIQLLKLTKH